VADRYLITGGAGYVGSILVPELLRAGHRVTVLDRFTAANPSLADCCRYEGFRAVRGDARDPRLLAELVAHADVVIPLAAVVGAPACAADPWGALETNSGAVTRLAEMVSRDQRLVYPNTNSGYGAIGSNRPCDEDTPLRPVSLYGRTKCEAEAAVLAVGGVSLRLATVFGTSPRMRLDLLVNDLVHRAATDGAVTLFEGHHRRSVVHVRDVARAFVLASGDAYPELSGQPYNVVGENVTKRELCERIVAQTPEFVWHEAPLREDPDRRDYAVSGDRIAAAGFTPEWSLDRGIAELLRGYTMLNARRFTNV
jgi:nucleoside-diphosphate-sugar epimerase